MNEIPSNGIFVARTRAASSFICPLQRHGDEGELIGKTYDFNAVSRHLNQLSKGNGFTIIKNEYKLRFHFHPCCTDFHCAVEDITQRRGA